ncbi:unnamed protein product [Polarella glacialis]|uniref:Uncharacterized protein n=1 Tax=Polarella glacialis TaxID=89957 RepID=A0A813HM74_POLGL|nr:unnamed protein product [Polarella glacialis]
MLDGQQGSGVTSPPGHVVCNVGHLPTAHDEDLRATVRSSLDIMNELSEGDLDSHGATPGFMANLLCVLPKPGMRRPLLHPGWQSVKEVNLSVWTDEQAAASWYRKSHAHANIVADHQQGRLRTFGNLLLTLKPTKVVRQRRCRACAAVAEGLFTDRCPRCSAPTFELPAF